MRIATKIWDSGWGAVFLFLYSLIVSHLLFPETHIYKPFAVIPTVLIMFLADQYSTTLVDFWAGGELKRTTESIESLTRDDHFYHAVGEDIQTSVDDFDRRAYQNNISILTGIIIAVTAPSLGFYHHHHVTGAILGCIIAVLAVHWLSRRSIHQLNTLARDIAEPYKAKYETQ